MNLLIGAFSYAGINKYKCTLYNFLYSVRKYNDSCKIVIICKNSVHARIIHAIFCRF